MARTSIKGVGANVFFPPPGKKILHPVESKIVKRTFRIPGNMENEFNKVFETIKKENFSFSKNQLGIIAMKLLFEQYKKGNLKIDI
ncbi:MAG TPA: hypothetical protein DCX95_07825 [Elusimicrobia bacterium]|nr:hypothetical protein [Elusimicrobiota bacterium]